MTEIDNLKSAESIANREPMDDEEIQQNERRKEYRILKRIEDLEWEQLSR